MAIKFEKIQPGMTLYDRHTYRMGNTTLRSIGEWPVYVVSVDREKGCAVVRWNGNPEETWWRGSLEKLSTWSQSDPDVVVERGLFGAVTRVRRLSAAERKVKAAESSRKESGA